MKRVRPLFALGLVWPLLAGLSASADVNAPVVEPIDTLIESAAYRDAGLDKQLDLLDGWLESRPTLARDIPWALAVSERITVLARQGNFRSAEAYVNEHLDDVLAALQPTPDYMTAVYAAGYVKIYVGKIEDTLLLIEKLTNHKAFDTDPIYQQNVDTLMMAIHSQTGNPILAAEIFLAKIESGAINDLQPLDQLKLIINTAYGLIIGRDYQRALASLHLANAKVEGWRQTGQLAELDSLQIHFLRWHSYYYAGLIMIGQDNYGDLLGIYPDLRKHSGYIRGPLYTSQTEHIEAAAAYGAGEFALADEIITRAIERTLDLESHDVLMDLYALQAKIKQARDDPRGALDAYLRREALADALKLEQSRARVEYVKTRNDLFERSTQIKELEAENRSAAMLRRRDQAIAIVALAALGTVAFFSLALLRSRRRLRSYADELEQSEKEAQIAAKAKSAFLANMSHEIRTPLNGLLGMAQVLSNRKISAELRECVDIILRSGQSLLAIVNDVLDLSKIEAGKMRISPTLTDIPALLDDIEQLWKINAQEKDISLRVDMDPSVPPIVKVDGIRLHQCVSNLVSNAIKFTKVGEVTIKAFAQNDGHLLNIVVKDTGIGVKPEAMDQLFSAFEQADTSTTRRFGGTGLGLAIIDSFVKLMGGKIELASVYGQGSAFTLSIPVEPTTQKLADHQAPIAAAHGDISETFDHIRTALLVDDNSVNRMVVRAFLKDSGAQIIEAENGREALDYLQHVGSADVVLLDMHMPVMDGPETIQHIRGRSWPARDVPIIVLTADAMEGDRERYLRLPVQGYIAKPVVRAELWNELHRIDDDLGAAASSATSIA